MPLSHRFYLFLLYSLLISPSLEASKRVRFADEEPATQKQPAAPNQMEALDLLENAAAAHNTESYRTDVCFQMLSNLGLHDDPDSAYTYKAIHDEITRLRSLVGTHRMACEALLNLLSHRKDSWTVEEQNNLVSAISSLRDTIKDSNFRLSNSMFPSEWSPIREALDASCSVNLNRLRLLGESCIQDMRACHFLRATLQPDESLSKLQRQLRLKDKSPKAPPSLHNRLTTLIDLHMGELVLLMQLYSDTSQRFKSNFVFFVDNCEMKISFPHRGMVQLTANVLKFLNARKRSIEEHLEGFSDEEKASLAQMRKSAKNIFTWAIGERAGPLHYEASSLKGYEEKEYDRDGGTIFAFDSSKCPEYQEYKSTYSLTFDNLIRGMGYYYRETPDWYGDEKGPLCAVLLLNKIFSE